MKRYASLIGPLLGLYFPLPDAPEPVQRVMMNTSRLKNLWHSIYTEEQAKDGVAKYGGALLPDAQAKALDYSSFDVQHAQANFDRHSAPKLPAAGAGGAP